MLSTFIIAAVLGALIGVATIAYRYFFGTSTGVTSNGWPIQSLNWAAWGVLIGAAVALIEVLAGKRLADTYGLRLVLSSIGGLVGSLIMWRVWIAISAPSAPTDPGTMEVKK